MEERKIINLLAPGVDEEEMAKKADLVDGKVPASQLPSYVDDVVEYASVAEFPDSGEQGKIYVALDSGFTYRWSGSEYIQIGGQDLSDYYTKDEADQLLATKQPVGDYATNTALTEGLATKQDVGDYATNAELTAGLATKQDVGDYATNTALTEGLATKQPVGDYATNTALTEGLATKQPVGDYATNTALETGLAGKQDVGDYATNTALTEGLATKQDVITDLDTIRAGAAAGATAVQPDETTDVEVSEDQVADAPLLGSIIIDDDPYNLPKKTSDLQNDAGFITDEDTTNLEMSEDQVTGAPLLGSITIDDNVYNLPKKVSDLQNDSGFVTDSYHDATKQDVGDYATNAALEVGLATKQPVGDYATSAELTAGLATKQPVGDYATNTALTSGLATKQNTLVSGTNIKTINGDSVLGSGDLVVVPTEATELEIRRLFRTEYPITTTILHGTPSGNTSIWTEETAEVTITPVTGYLVPEEITVTGATSSYNDTTGVVSLAAVTDNVTLIGECVLPKLSTPVISLNNDDLTFAEVDHALSYDIYDGDIKVGTSIKMPEKGDIIDFDPFGDGTQHRFRVLKMSNKSVAQVLSLENSDKKMLFAHRQSYETATFDNGNRGAKYANNIVDTYLNTTYYNSLSVGTRSAIVPETRTQSMYSSSKGNSESADVIIARGPDNYSYTRIDELSIGSRNIYVLDIDDIRTYFDNANFIYGFKIAYMFFGSGVSTQDNWLSSVKSLDTEPPYVYASYFYGYWDKNNQAYAGLANENIDGVYADSFYVHPAFSIDLSQIEFTIEE